jgi:hypothetical protein
MSLLQAYPGGDSDMRPGWWLHFTQWPDAVEELTTIVPAACREFDEDTGRWWIAEHKIKIVYRMFPTLEKMVDQPRLL